MNALRKSRLTPLLVILFLGCVSINIVMYTFRDYMDANFGRGEAVILPDEEEVVPVYYRWKTVGSFLTEGKQEHALSASTQEEGTIGAAGQGGLQKLLREDQMSVVHRVEASAENSRFHCCFSIR